MLLEGDLTLGREHTIQYTDDVLQNCTPETYIVLLSNVTPVNSIKKKRIVFRTEAPVFQCSRGNQVPGLELTNTLLIGSCTSCVLRGVFGISGKRVGSEWFVWAHTPGLSPC